jgi:integrase
MGCAASSMHRCIELRAERVDIAVITRQLGHRSLLTTIEYLDHLAPAAVLKRIGRREWGDRQCVSALSHSGNRRRVVPG